MGYKSRSDDMRWINAARRRFEAFAKFIANEFD